MYPPPTSAVVRVRLFAALADARGWRDRELPLAPDMTVRSVWTAATGEAALPARVLCARNMDYCAADERVVAGDEVAFFPPVTGGAA